MNPLTLREQFQTARRQGLRAREAAESIGQSEGAALAAHCGTHDQPLKVTALQGPWIDLLQALNACGPLMALTRNDTTVHEKTGVYENVSFNGHVGLALGQDIDLRLFLNQWHAGFAVTEAPTHPARPTATSLQFFDCHGRAVHKVYPREHTHLTAWQAVMARFASTSPCAPFEALGATKPPCADEACDRVGFLAGWRKMTDTHQFFWLLREFGVARQQGLRLAEGTFTERLENDALRTLLSNAAFDGTPLMSFVGNEGCIQIHSGPIQRVEPLEMKGRTPDAPSLQWLNILDPGFNLHLREDLIAHTWLVRKPTDDGTVTSVEAFDADGGLMVMFFGARKPGQPESTLWRALTEHLPRLETSTA